MSRSDPLLRSDGSPLSEGYLYRGDGTKKVRRFDGLRFEAVSAWRHKRQAHVAAALIRKTGVPARVSTEVKPHRMCNTRPKGGRPPVPDRYVFLVWVCRQEAPENTDLDTDIL